MSQAAARAETPAQATIPAGPAPATPDGAVDIPFPGGFARYVTPNRITRWRCDTFFEKERDTLAWIETFEAGDVLVDIGANVGMYTVWAAKTRGVKVFAFEPESQNYALLNMNLFMNGLSEQVSAYCLALSSAAGFDHLHLARFEPGGSCHAFGAPLDPNLKPTRTEFRQGCFAAPLDDLVDAGVVPAPTHVKIDVDGLEHAVVQGMERTLASAGLKSVLIEINGALEEHQALATRLVELGFHVDDRQRAASLQTEGYFAGAGNIIFWKDAAAAERLGARLAATTPASNAAAVIDAVKGPRSAAPKVAGLTADEAMEAAMAAITAAPVATDPTPYWYCEEVFPPAFYEEMLARMPAKSQFTPITDLGWVDGRQTRQAKRGVLPFGDADLDRLPEDLATFWRGLAAGFRSERFALTMLRKFLPQIGERFGPNVGNVTFSASAMLLADDGGYALGPHTDRPERVLAALFYLPADAARPELGTSLYLPKDPAFACAGGPHHRFEDFVNVATMPYLPNSAFCFFKTRTSFHGVEPVSEDGARRRLISYILETGA